LEQENLRPTHRKHNRFHDYRKRSIYHFTMVVSGREPVLGALEGVTKNGAIVPYYKKRTEDEEANDPVVMARMQLTALGTAVSRQIAMLPERARQKGYKVRILQKCVMDTHIHFVLFVEEDMKEKVGMLIRGFKQGCNKALRESLAMVGDVARLQISPAQQGTGQPTIAGMFPSFAVVKGGFPCRDAHLRVLIHNYPAHSHLVTSPRLLYDHALFEDDFDETILIKRGQLDRMIKYVHDNPWRKWIKIHYRNRFLPTRGITIAGRTFDAIGNLMLLALLRSQVHVRSHFTEQERRDYMNNCIIKARHNYALVSPFVSPYERMVRDVALQEGHSIIQLVDNGFTEYTSCPGDLYDYCINSQVLLLVLSDFPHIDKKKTISRNECVMLNGLAGEIVGE